MNPWDWEDVAIALVQFVFIAALVPVLRDKKAAIPVRTSALTGLGMLVITIAFVGLGQWLSVVTAFVSMCAWFAVMLLRPVRRAR